MIHIPHRMLEAWPPLQRLVAVHYCGEAPGYSALSLHRLENPEVLATLLHRFACLYPGVNRAAVASQWSMNYLSVVMPSMLVPALVTNLVIDLEQDDVALLHDDARPMTLKFTSEPRPLGPGQWPAYCERLFFGHLEAIMAGLSTAGGIAPKVLWNNLVVAWDELFRRLGVNLQGRCDLDLEGAHRWLEQAWIRDGKIQLRQLQRLVDSPAPELGAQISLRRHCCLHFQLHAPVEGEFPVWCESCPKLHRRPQEEQVRYLYQLQMED